MNPRCVLCVADAVGVCLECDQPVCGIHEALAEHDCASACGTWRERVDNITRQRDEARAERDAAREEAFRIAQSPASPLHEAIVIAQWDLNRANAETEAAEAERDRLRDALRHMLESWDRYDCITIQASSAARAALAGSAPASEPALYRCTCGHSEGEHVRRRKRHECTVCTCNNFDWDDSETAPPPSGDPDLAPGATLSSDAVASRGGAKDGTGTELRYDTTPARGAQEAGISPPASAGDKPGEAAGLKSGANPTANAGNAAPAASPSEPEPGVPHDWYFDNGDIYCKRCSANHGELVNRPCSPPRAAVPEEPRRCVHGNLYGPMYPPCAACAAPGGLDIFAEARAAAPKVEDPCGDVFGNPGVISWNCRLPRGHEAGHSIFVEDACVSVLRARLAALEEVARLTEAVLADAENNWGAEIWGEPDCPASLLALRVAVRAARLKETTP